MNEPAYSASTSSFLSTKNRYLRSFFLYSFDKVLRTRNIKSVAGVCLSGSEIRIPRENRRCCCCCWLVFEMEQNRHRLWGERVSTRWERRSADVQSRQEYTRHIPTHSSLHWSVVSYYVHTFLKMSTLHTLRCRFETICCLHHTLQENKWRRPTTADFLRLLCNNGIFRCWCLVWSNWFVCF